MLGGLAARLGRHGPPVALANRKAQALLAYLAMSGTRPRPREELATLLWSDADAADGRNSLRQTLFLIRRALPDAGVDYLHVSRATVALDGANVVSDVSDNEGWRAVKETLVKSVGMGSIPVIRVDEGEFHPRRPAGSEGLQRQALRLRVCFRLPVGDLFDRQRGRFAQPEEQCDQRSSCAYVPCFDETQTRVHIGKPDQQRVCEQADKNTEGEPRPAQLRPRG